MKNIITSDLLIYEDIFKIKFLSQSYYWYKNIGYDYLQKTRHINFPILHWYNYFSHPNDNWLLIGGYINYINKKKLFNFIFYIQHNFNLKESKIIAVEDNFYIYISKNIKNISLDFYPNNLYEYQTIKIEKSMFPKTIKK